MISAALSARLRERPLRELPARALRLLAREVGRARARWGFRRGRLSVGPADLERALGPGGVEAALAALGRAPLGITPLDGQERRAFASELRAAHPSACEKVLAKAEDALAHRFELLGSDPVELGPCIDWLTDFKTGFRWEPGFFADLVLVDLANDADVKVPWELSRCQHFVTLGQAFWLTGGERYAAEFAAQLRSWLDANPAGGSVNWGNAMEAAIRIVNWLWAVSLMRDATSFTREDRVRFLCSALEHGRFVVDHLEMIPGCAASNHYLSDLAGLVYLGTLLPFFRDSREWLRIGTRGLTAEMATQVHRDGVDYEASIGYHRLVTEIFSSSFALCRQNGVEIPAAAWERLAAMLGFTLHYTRPDGKAPAIGDLDNGRLHILTPGPADDHRHLLGFGGALFERRELLAAAGEFAHEAAWWFGVEASRRGAAAAPTPGSASFPEGGFYVMRHADRYLIADCAHPAKLRGHAHNGTLGFELSACGRAFIVDCGSFVYTASARWRNHFRATAAHNVVMVDGIEMNSIREDELFNLGAEAKPQVITWRSEAADDLLVAQHDGYERIGNVGLHRRRILFRRREDYWLIEDHLEGEGEHRLQAFLHLDHGLELERLGSAEFLASDTRSQCGLLVSVSGLDPGWRLASRDDWVSPSYGVRLPAKTLELDVRTVLPVTWTWLLQPVPDRGRPPEPPEARVIP